MSISLLWSALAVSLLGATRALAGESVASAEPFEINAVRSQAGRFNYVARVFAHQDSLCTGTLISDNVVLTAAHCFGFRPLSSPRPFTSPIIDPTVIFGYNITAPPTVFPAIPPTAAAIHPLYTRGSSKYDIALIRIDQNNYSGPEPTFFPTPIKHRAQAPISSTDYNTTVTSLGWGNTDPTGRNLTLFLRDVNLTLTDPSSPMCQGLNTDNKLLDSNTGFCMVGLYPTAQEIDDTLAEPKFPDYRKGFCHGDSGGPTIVQGATTDDDILIGVNEHLLSNVPGVYICGNPNLGDVSTSVGAYSNFIESMLHEFQDNRLPVVNITGMVISQIGYGSHGFGKTGQVTFLVNLTVQTDYLMERVGVYADYGVLPNPGFALRSAGAGHNATTVLPFNIIDFEAPSFTYTLEAVAYQVVADFTLEFISSQVRMDTSLQVVFKPFAANEYTNVVAEVSAQQLMKALCGTPSPHDTIVTALFQAFCSRA